jgi:hypothetical protein
MESEREMSLDEWVNRLPEIHRAHRELKELKIRAGELSDEWDENDSGLIRHAKRELKALGYIPLEEEQEDGPNKWIQKNILELLRVFAKQGHSGGSAPYCISMFKSLASFEPLAPLQGTDDEWNETLEDELWQNNRCSHVFKDKNGAYDIDGVVFIDQHGNGYTNSDSKVPVSFPYTPHTEYVHIAVPDETEDADNQ